MLLALAGKIIYFLGSLPNVYDFARQSRSGHAAGHKRNFKIIFGAVLALTCVGFLMIGPFGRIIVPLLFGNKAAAILPYLIEYSAAIVMFTLANSVAVYHLAKKQYYFRPFLLFFRAYGNRHCGKSRRDRGCRQCLICRKRALWE